MGYKSTTSALVIIGLGIIVRGLDTENNIITLFGVVVFLLGIIPHFYYINKYEHIVSRLIKWMKRNKLLNGSDKMKHSRKRGSSKSTGAWPSKKNLKSSKKWNK